MNALVTATCAAGGLFLGDSLEVVVERLGARRPVDRPWWRCPACGARPATSGLVPLVRVRARAQPCPNCGEAVVHPWRPAALAVTSAAVLGGFAARLGADVALLAYVVLGLALVAIAAVDLERQIIPNRIVYPTLGLMVPLLVIASAADDKWGALADAAIGGAGAFAAFFAVHVAVPRGMGFGDVRLAGVVGVATGWLGFGPLFVAFLASFVLGAAVGVVAMAVSGAGRKTRIPFGPFLAAGAVVAVLWGAPLAHALFHRGT
ncbi:MAG TPA: A24 family peptidase [Acidimicrobiales bacterium]|nr:A24 family peptidase [Acidimicrobiales bacterium]